MVSKAIRVRVCLAAVRNKRILLVPHYDTDVGPVQWNLPGGAIRFGEKLQKCAIREFKEETGLHAKIERVIDVTEVVKPRQPWHSITVTCIGRVTGGRLQVESSKRHGKKRPRWFSASELKGLKYHPKQTIDKVLNQFGCVSRTTSVND